MAIRNLTKTAPNPVLSGLAFGEPVKFVFW